MAVRCFVARCPPEMWRAAARRAFRQAGDGERAAALQKLVPIQELNLLAAHLLAFCHGDHQGAQVRSPPGELCRSLP